MSGNPHLAHGQACAKPGGEALSDSESTIKADAQGACSKTFPIIDFNSRDKFRSSESHSDGPSLTTRAPGDVTCDEALLTIGSADDYTTSISAGSWQTQDDLPNFLKVQEKELPCLTNNLFDNELFESCAAASVSRENLFDNELFESSAAASVSKDLSGDLHSPAPSSKKPASSSRPLSIAPRPQKLQRCVLAKRAEDWANARLTDLIPDMFEPNTVIFSTHNVLPPAPFNSVWHGIGRGHRNLTLLPREREAVKGASLILIFTDTEIDWHLNNACDTASQARCLRQEGLPIFLLHHTMAPELRHATEERNKFESETLMMQVIDAGIDDVICEEPCGMELIFRIRSRMMQREARERSFASKVDEYHARWDHYCILEEQVHEAVWQYARVRLQTGLPCIDDDISPGRPKSVPGFDVGRELGSGAFGKVYKLRATDSSDGSCSQVLKVLDKSNMTSIRGIKGLKSQLKVIDLLRTTEPNPNVVEFFEVYHSETHVLFRMECAGRMNLFTILVQRQENELVLSKEHVRSLVKQCCSSLDHLYMLQVVHRDVKPENFAAHVTTDGVMIKLVDFDTSRVVKQSQPRQQCFRGMVGTFPFVSPEVILCSEYDPYPVDIWSLGFVLLEVFCRVSVVCKSLNLSRPPRAGNRCQKEAMERLSTMKIRDFFSNDANIGVMLRDNLRPELRDLKDAAEALLAGMLKVEVDDRWPAYEVFELCGKTF